MLVVAVLSYVVWFTTRPKPIEVELATITRGTVESTVVNTRAGTIKACRRAKLAPASGGQIVKLRVKEGERVKQGQVLMVPARVYHLAALGRKRLFDNVCFVPKADVQT